MTNDALCFVGLWDSRVQMVAFPEIIQRGKLKKVNCREPQLGFQFGFVRVRSDLIEFAR